MAEKITKRKGFPPLSPSTLFHPLEVFAQTHGVIEIQRKSEAKGACSDEKIP
jgi:hypothetical protein